MVDTTSGTLDLSNNSKLFRGLDVHEINASGNSMEDSLSNYFTYGVGAAAVSAGVGLLNTTTALGEAIGIVDPGHQLDESDSVNSLLGADAASFYDRHKEGIDAAGFVGGSLIPGLGSIRALRFAQTAGKMGTGLEAVTGLRNADIVMNSPTVEAAKKYALSTTTASPNWFSTPMIRAYATGVKQQVLEAGVFEAGNLALNNQNASLNPDDMGYFTAIGNQYWDGLKFAALGGVVGGAVDALRIAGATRKFVGDEWTRTAPLNTLKLDPNFDNLDPGSKLLDIGQEAARRTELGKTIDPNDWFGRRQFNAGDAQLKSDMLATFGQANTAGNAGLDVLNSMVQNAEPAQLSSMAEVLSGMKSIGNVSSEDLSSLQDFYSKTRAPITIASGDDIESIAFQIADEQKSFFETASKVMQDGDVAGLVYPKSIEGFIAGNQGNSAGFALSNGAFRSMKGLTDKFNARVVSMNKDLTGIFPDFVGLNNEKIGVSYELTKAYNKRMGKDFTMSQDQYRSYVLLHELGHVKNNPEKMTTLIQNTLSDINNNITSTDVGAQTKKVINQLVGASIRSRESAWTLALGNKFAAASEEDKIAMAVSRVSKGNPDNKQLAYLGNGSELLADGAAYMMNPATRELAAKNFPELAKMFDAEGGVAKAWNPTKAYYNSRTKQIYSSYLPGIVDVDPKATIKAGTLQSGVLGKTFNTDSSAFTPEVINAGLSKGSKLDYLHYDAQWALADKLTAKQLADKSGTINLNSDNLPAMEKVHALNAGGDAEVRKAFYDGKVFLNGSSVTPEALPELVQQSKEEIRRKLAISAAGYNEHEIAKILNIDLPHSYGDLSADKSSWLLMGKKDYSKPELFTMNYEHKSIGDYQGAVMNQTGVSMLNDAVDSQVKATAAELTGSLYKNLVDIPENLMATVNPMNSRAGLINNTRAEMGSLRERATYIGKQVAEYIKGKVQSVDSSYIAHSDVFNKRENAALRFELANIDNILKREDYYIGHTADGTGSYIFRKDQIGNAMDAAQKDLSKSERVKFSPDMLSAMPKGLMEGMDSSDAWAPGAVKVSDDVAKFLQQHVDTNSSIIDRKSSLAKVKGKQVTLDPNVLYSPPRDLRQTKYFGFVIPNTFREGADSRRFMVFGETEAEFESKRLAIQQKYGNDYQVLTKQDVGEYNALRDEYEKGNVFDELQFDGSMQNRGRASEIAPNIDTNFSSTLDRYRTWTIRQEEALTRAGVELKYNGIVQQLNRLDRHYGNVEASTLDKKFQEPATIWKDTLGTILNKRERGSALESTFVRVNDYLGEKGSQFMERVLSGLRDVKGDAQITQSQLDKFNGDLAKAGYQSPFDDVAHVILSSPDTLRSNAFPAAVRTMSNLVSTLMLRLDPCNSMLQLISTPILTLPVLQEAKLALAGTKAGEDLKNLTTVVNPATGMAEPTSGKMLAKATAAYFTDEGKAFVQELRDRNIIKDHLGQYLTAIDMAQLNGRHTMAAVNHKIDQLGKFGSTLSRHDWAEDFSRFVVAHSVKQLTDIRGVGTDEAWALINGAVDKVHGVYAGAQRPQLFQGVVGQSVGLFQTYFFNFVQNMMKYTADGNRAQAATLLGMQSSLFGVSSLPGFGALNEAIGNSNKQNQDLYSITNADDPKSSAAYAMYGLASTMFGNNVDFATRGSLAARNMLVIPTQFKDLPIVGTLSKAVGNMIDTAANVEGAENPQAIARAMLHGLAHNGMNRPLGGLATIAMGDVTSNQGQINWQNSNHINYAMNEDINWGGMFARAIGTRPLNETIVQNSYFRQAAYKANMHREQQELAAKVQINLASGAVTPSSMQDFAEEYEESGGEVQSFNSFMMRQLKNSGNPTMEKFQQDMMRQKDSKLSRSSTRMELKQSSLTPWSTDY